MPAAARSTLRSLRAAAGQSPRTGLSLVMVIPGALLLAVGWVGHLAARLLTAAIGRTREFHADALAVRLTRNPKGLGNALRKISWMGIHDPASRVAGPGRLPGRHATMRCSSRIGIPAAGGSRWLATHPPLAARIERLLGEAAAPMVAERRPRRPGFAVARPVAGGRLARLERPARAGLRGRRRAAGEPATRSGAAAAREAASAQRRPGRAGRREPRQQQRRGDGGPAGRRQRRRGGSLAACAGARR